MRLPERHIPGLFKFLILNPQKSMLAIVYKFVMIGLPESEANNKHVVTFKNLKNFIASSTGNNFFNLNSNLDDGVLKL